MKKIFLGLMFVLMLAGCGLTKEKLGMTRVTPDDGYQERKSRLVVPPEYSVRPDKGENFGN